MIRHLLWQEDLVVFYLSGTLINHFLYKHIFKWKTANVSSSRNPWTHTYRCERLAHICILTHSDTGSLSLSVPEKQAFNQKCQIILLFYNIYSFNQNTFICINMWYSAGTKRVIELGLPPGFLFFLYVFMNQNLLRFKNFTVLLLNEMI